MQALPLRFTPGEDLRRVLEAIPGARGSLAGFVLAGIGSLGPAVLRLAGEDQARVVPGELELLTLSGTLAPGAAHLHASLADRAGHVLGGHLAYGSIARTTAEVLVLLLPEWAFERTPDAATGFSELVVRQRGDV
jgi:predicted DNA-binding protein with PD1-like motif